MAPTAKAAQPIDIAAFARTQLALLATELAAETASTGELLASHAPTTLARAGLAILNLSVANRRTGLGGKTVLELELDPAVKGGDGVDTKLPEHDIRTGDIVRVGPQPRGSEKKRDARKLEEAGAQAVVVRAMDNVVQVALDREEDDAAIDGRIWVVKLANEVTYKRMNWVMERMQKMDESEHTSLMRVLFGQSSPTPLPGNLEDPATGSGPVTFKDPTLNDSQKAAVRFALASREVSLIHGPPGTGKTYTLIELIRQLVDRGARVLVCGPSNISVDNIVERLSPYKLPLVRLGHPARLLPGVLSHSLDVLTRTSDAAEIVRDIRNELDAKQASIKKTKSGRERREIYGQMKDLRKEFRERERRCVETLVQGSKVVFATLHGAGGHQLRHEKFDVVIVDEASQALEAQCWIPLLTARKVVLAGDQLQLPPTVKSLNSKQPAKSKVKDKSNVDVISGVTLEDTLFSRLLSLHGFSIRRMLTTQYRMHELIMRFPSDELYDGELIAADSVATRLLPELDYGVTDTDDTREALVFYDTQGGDFPEVAESVDEDSSGGVPKSSLLSDSKSNALEAALAADHVRRLVDAGVRPEDIAVVTPYNAQLALLSALLPRDELPGLELGSIDGFQGREKEAVVVSLVRSNPKREVGFLAEKRRLNVAMTRPRRHLCVIGDSDTVSAAGGYLKRWMAHLEEHADLRYPDAGELG